MQSLEKKLMGCEVIQPLRVVTRVTLRYLRRPDAHGVVRARLRASGLGIARGRPRERISI
ncbi:MAG: hypothetical protein CSA75_03780 [Sorangium cellulosum]|nr:MAG: hypothetical protein CSA75_03780 [Sorangium cellulosum]